MYNSSRREIYKVHFKYNIVFQAIPLWQTWFTPYNMIHIHRFVMDRRYRSRRETGTLVTINIGEMITRACHYARKRRVQWNLPTCSDLGNWSLDSSELQFTRTLRHVPNFGFDILLTNRTFNSVSTVPKIISLNIIAWVRTFAIERNEKKEISWFLSFLVD